MSVSIKESAQVNSNGQKHQLQLKDIVKTLPREVFIKDRWKTWAMVTTNIFMVILGYWGLIIAPWFLLPLLWVFTGTALTGFFVIGHDCGHRSFANRRWVNDLVGHLVFLPLIYPFHGWRIGHNHHHKHTNKMGEDNAWQPWYPEDYKVAGSFMQSVYRLMRGRLWWLASIPHWALVHFDWRKFERRDREDVKFSALVVFGFSASLFPLLIATVGLWGLVKFWLIPWLVYHFWMSTFTIVHHTVPEVPFTPAQEWNEAEAQLFGTVHCDYPRWVEFLCHDINVHIPHHISIGIPSYNLRQAHQFLKDKWGDKLYETHFSWSLMKKITDQCHLYNQTKFYLSFKEYDAQKVSQ